MLTGYTAVRSRCYGENKVKSTCTLFLAFNLQFIVFSLKLAKFWTFLSWLLISGVISFLFLFLSTLVQRFCSPVGSFSLFFQFLWTQYVRQIWTLQIQPCPPWTAWISRARCSFYVSTNKESYVMIPLSVSRGRLSSRSTSRISENVHNVWNLSQTVTSYVGWINLTSKLALYQFCLGRMRP